MAHPKMFDDGDPYLARVRQVALAFPQAQETVSHGRPTFRSQKVFAVYGGGTKGPAATRIRYEHSLLLLPDAAEGRSEEHTSELQSRGHLVCRLLLEKKNTRPPNSEEGRHS